MVSKHGLRSIYRLSIGVGMFRHFMVISLLVACEPDTKTAISDPIGQTILEDSDGDGYFSDDDCDDTDSTVNPSESEVCDGRDNNCDGSIDEGVTEVFYRDSDGDGYGDPYQAVEACTVPEGFVLSGNDCNDLESASYPAALEICDDLDNDCDGLVDDEDSSLETDTGASFFVDADGDGFGDPTTMDWGCDIGPGRVEDDSDCDDDAPAIHPAASEVCDGLDNDCDALVDTEDDSLDETTLGQYYGDDDSDGFGDENSPLIACELPAGYVDNDFDCDDLEIFINPFADEVCDSQDNDCDGLIDDEDDNVDLSTGGAFYVDSDGDGYGNSNYSVMACELTEYLSANGDDCDDNESTTFPGAAEHEDFGTACHTDADGDGYAPLVEGGGDCDDTRVYYNPDMTDIVGDGRDQNCDGVDGTDGDGDGDPSQASGGEDCDDTDASRSSVDGDGDGESVCGGDCDDTDGQVSTISDEYCDELDNNCNGVVDEEPVDGTPWYSDVDGDGYGGATFFELLCEMPEGSTAEALDCNDFDVDISPDSVEVCDFRDNNCDGVVDEAGAVGAVAYYADVDEDGFGDPDSAQFLCSQPDGTVDNGDDCTDTDSAFSPIADELCDGVDNNCDGVIDESTAVDAYVYYADADGDGYGDTTGPMPGCTQPLGTVTNADDCEDGDPFVSPDSIEVCDGIDNDCDGTSDNSEALDAEVFFVDADGDGLGDPSIYTTACSPPSGYVFNSDDCDDSDASDTDNDGLQDCEDDDKDGDGLRNDWDAYPLDTTLAVGPREGFGFDGILSQTSDVVFDDWTLLSNGAASGTSELVVDNASMFGSGDELLLLSQQGVDAGNYQTLFVIDVDLPSGTLTVEPHVSEEYSASSIVLVQRIPHYTSILITSASTWSAEDWSGGGGGVMFVRVFGDVNIDGNVTVSKLGYRGGAGVFGNSYNPIQGESYLQEGAEGDESSNDGGGGALPAGPDGSDCGGGGGHGTDGTNGENHGGAAVTDGGAAYGDAALLQLFFGSGGGGGSPDAETDGEGMANYSGDGGDGGGIIVLYAGGHMNISGSIQANGGDGVDAYSPSSSGGENGGGGAGAGGTIYLSAETMSLSGAISAMGGVGGEAESSSSETYNNGFGGDGGDGRIRLDANVITGETTPVAGFLGSAD